MNARERVIICVPGVLARSEQQHSPLLLESEADKVVYYDYSGIGFDMKLEGERLAREISFYLDYDYDVCVLGTSIGVNVTAFASHCERINLDGWNNVVLIDGPFGKATLSDMPNWLPGWFVTSSLFGEIFTKGARRDLSGEPKDKALPQREFTTKPSDREVLRRLTGNPDITNADYIKFVRDGAREGLMGHDPAVFAQQLQEMVGVERNGSLAKAVRTLKGRTVTQIVCIGEGNTVVEQPLAADRYSEILPDMKSVNVNAVHAGYRENQPEMARAILPNLWRG